MSSRVSANVFIAFVNARVHVVAGESPNYFPYDCRAKKEATLISELFCTSPLDIPSLIAAVVHQLHKGGRHSVEYVYVV